MGDLPDAFPIADFIDGFFAGPRAADGGNGESVFLMALACRMGSGPRLCFVILADEAFNIRDAVEGQSSPTSFHPRGQLGPADAALRDAGFAMAKAGMKVAGIPADIGPYLVEHAEVDLIEGRGLRFDLAFVDGTRRVAWTDAKGAMEFRIAVDRCHQAGMRDLRLPGG